MTTIKSNLHPRNKHRKGYNFQKLIKATPDLKNYVRPNEYGKLSVDFFNPKAVKILNTALLQVHYNIQNWDIPDGYLCPPVPGRADYIHHIADLLARGNRGLLPKGTHIRCLDVGVGANCIYPILGHQIYGWSFLASDIHPTALKAANQNIEKNKLQSAIDIRLQTKPKAIFQGILNENSKITVSFCNPPFHESAKQATREATRKLKNLSSTNQKLNFGGQANELWCAGGEVAFIKQMIRESQLFAKQCLWFTSLVSKEAHLKTLILSLQKVNIPTYRILPMGQGSKISRVLAWTFFSETERRNWMNNLNEQSHTNR